MTFRPGDDGIQYRSRRLGSVPSASFAATYRPIGPEYRLEPGSPEEFLLKRYTLFTQDRQGRVFRCDVHHDPWVLQNARADVRTNTMLDPLDITPVSDEVRLHYAEKVQAVAWRPVSIERGYG